MKHYTVGRRSADGASVAQRRRAGHGEARAFIEAVVMNHVGDECLYWPFALASGGYAHCGDPEGNLVHRQVCIRKYGAPPTQDHQAAHSCGKGHLGCVSPQHVHWATAAENQQQRVEHGTSNRGEGSARAKLTAKDVADIRALRGVLSQSTIARRFGVRQPTICKIFKGERWKSAA